MGASSVTGVGLGSAERTAKGPVERAFVGVEKIIGPRVVYATQATVEGAGTVVVSMPFNMVHDYYGVLASAPNAVTVTKTIDGVTGYLTSVTITGTVADLVDVIVVKLGQQGQVASGVDAANH